MEAPFATLRVGLSSLLTIFPKRVLVEENGDERRSGNGDQGSNDAGESRTNKESDENREPHQVDGGFHDARREDGIFKVNVDRVKDENTGHLGPGVKRRDARGSDDGDDAASDRNDIQQTHQHSKEYGVPHMQRDKNDSAADAQDEHEGALTDEPLAHLVLCDFERSVEAVTVLYGKETEKELIGVFSFKHEVDGEKHGSEDIEDMAEPVGKRGEEVASGGGESALSAFREVIDPDLIGNRVALQLGDLDRDAGWDLCDKGAKVVQDRRKGYREEHNQSQDGTREKEHDGESARRAPATNAKSRNPSNDGKQDHSKQSADVNDLELFEKMPSKIESQQEGKKKGDMAASHVAAALGVFDKDRLIRRQGKLLLWSGVMR